MMMLYPEDVAAFLGRGQESTFLALAEQHLPIVTAFVRAYTRGNGFDQVTGDPVDDVAAVITTATARLVSNPTNRGPSAVGAFSETPGVFNGFTLPELAVLHLYRKRTA